MSPEITTTLLTLLSIGIVFLLLRSRQLASEKKEHQGRSLKLEAQIRTQLEEIGTLQREIGKGEERAELVRRLETQNSSLQDELEQVGKENGALNSELSKLNERIDRERASFEEQLALLEKAKTEMSESFSKLSLNALDKNSQRFLTLASELFDKKLETSKSDLKEKHESFSHTGKEVKTLLDSMSKKIEEVEKQRLEEHGDMKRYLQTVFQSTEKVGKQAQQLHEALRHSRVQGQWGELQLRNVVETAGMLEHCDFQEQVQAEQGSGRPDLVVSLPNKRTVIVDAKAPVSAVLEAMETEDPALRKKLFADHSSALREHIKQLSARDYPSQFESALDFTLLFLPGESFFYAAMENDHSLTRFATEKRIILVTPMSLIAFLRSAAYGWREAKLSDNAREIRTLGKELYERMQKFNERFNKLGKSLSTAVKDYNSASGSMERRLLVTTRKLHQLGASTQKTLPSPELVDSSVHLLEGSSEESVPSPVASQPELLIETKRQ